MLQIIRMLRPEQWVKNFFVFLPLFFGQEMTNKVAIIHTCIAFIAFSLISSSIYCFNDIIDIEADKLHPRKKHRPLASGKLSKTTGWISLIVCAMLSFLISFLNKDSHNMFPIIIISYFLLNISYTIKLKRYVIVDVFVIAINFVLRLVSGSVTAGVTLSHWIVMMTFLLALFLAFAKRREDVLFFENTGVKSRANISRYNIPFLNSVLSILAAVTIVSYLMYTVSPEVIERFNSPYIYLTSIFVIAGILRYLHLTQVHEQSGSPTKILLKDRFIHFTIVGWIASFVVLIYFR